MVKTLEELREEADTLRRKKEAKESLEKLARKRRMEEKRLKTEISELRSPRRTKFKQAIKRVISKASEPPRTVPRRRVTRSVPRRRVTRSVPRRRVTRSVPRRRVVRRRPIRQKKESFDMSIIPKGASILG